MIHMIFMLFCFVIAQDCNVILGNGYQKMAWLGLCQECQIYIQWLYITNRSIYNHMKGRYGSPQGCGTSKTIHIQSHIEFIHEPSIKFHFDFCIHDSPSWMSTHHWGCHTYSEEPNGFLQSSLLTRVRPGPVEEWNLNTDGLREFCKSIMFAILGSLNQIPRQEHGTPLVWVWIKSIIQKTWRLMDESQSLPNGSPSHPT